ncbi:MAG: type II toxin-antitoxin system VapC family toxin [Gaiellaceae bacterium]
MSSAPTAADAPTYVDSSAFMKLVVAEPESDALRLFLTQSPRRLTASTLLDVEATRVARAAGGSAANAMAEALRAVVLVDVTPSIRARARLLDPVHLRTLDAIHLATALETGAREIIVYDNRLASAAATYGMDVWSPGA